MGEQTKPQFIGTAALQEIANKYHDDIMLSAAYFRPDVFDRLGIKVISGIEFQDTINVAHRKGHTARRKVVGDELSSSAGYIEERKMITQPVWDRIPDNQDNYREQAVFSNVDGNVTYTYPKTEKFFRETVVITFGENCFDCLFLGDASLDRKSEEGWLGLYDGLVTNIRKDIAAGRVSHERRNLVDLTSINSVETKEDIANWNIFKKFVNSWHPTLRNQQRVNVLMTTVTAERICAAYCNAHNSNTAPIYGADRSIQFSEYPNIYLTPEASFGIGDLMIASVPGNMEYGIDNLNSKSTVNVQYGSSKDAKDVFFQIESIMGTRVANPNPQKFCVSNGTLQPIGLAGDYLHDSLAVLSSDEKLGTVAKSPDQEDYVAGTTVTLTATPTETGAFVRWSDGNENASRAFVTKGQPDAITAIFREK